jgi:hypothetical protein
MKRVFCVIIFLGFKFINAQAPELFQYTWRLESITTDTDSFMPDSNPDPNTGTFNYIIFYNQNNGVPYYFQFGVYGSVLGENLIFSNNQSFYITNITLLTGESSLASSFLINNFLFEDQTNNIIYNPFTYSFSYNNDLIYLHITNSEGSVATFYDNFLSSEQFLEDNISIYPNPLKDILTIKSSDVILQSISIFNLQGKILFNCDDLGNNQLDLSSLPQGMYILKIKTDQGVSVKKLVKE